MNQLKKTLARLFDDQAEHHGWQRGVRAGIVTLICLSAALSFIETFDSFAANVERELFVVDYVIIAIFSIEIAARIWVGGWRYVFSFYGLVDIWSTYPFYLTFFMPIPYAALRILRVLRLMRLLRYMRSSHILIEAVKSKRQEMWISIQFLVIITFVLSIMLYHVEHTAQPDVYKDGIASTIWAFAQYIGDPGGFADYSPVTFWGRIIACAVGILGIAIFAVPAGIIGSAFIEVIDDEKKSRANKENVEKIRCSFRSRMCRDTLVRFVPAFCDLATVQATRGLSEQEIFDAVGDADDLRIVNLGNTYPFGKTMPPHLALETFPINTVYGVKVDRGSNVTIIATSCPLEPGLGWMSWYLATFGGFNYVAKHVETTPLNPVSYFNFSQKPEEREESLKIFLDDINSMMRPDKENYAIALLTSSFGDEPEYPTEFHFQFGARQRGDESYDDPNLTINNVEAFDAMFTELNGMLKTHGLEADHHRFHKSSARNIIEQLDKSANRFTIRIAAEFMLRNSHRVSILKQIAEIMLRHFSPSVEHPRLEALEKIHVGYMAEL